MEIARYAVDPLIPDSFGGLVLGIIFGLQMAGVMVVAVAHGTVAYVSLVGTGVLLIATVGPFIGVGGALMAGVILLSMNAGSLLGDWLAERYEEGESEWKVLYR